QLTLRHFARKDKQKESVDVIYFALEGKGDSIVIRCEDGSLVVVDTGGREKELVLAVKAYFGGKPPPIRIVITHTDSDHIGGLNALVTDPETADLIDEVIVGRSSKEARPKVTDLLAILQKHFTGKNSEAP